MYVCQSCGFTQHDATADRCDVCNSKNLTLKQEPQQQNSSAATTVNSAAGVLLVILGIAVLAITAALWGFERAIAGYFHF